MKPEKQKGRRADLRWLLLLAELLESTGSGAGGLQRPAMLLLLPPLSSVFCYFICFFFFLFFDLLSLSLFFLSALLSPSPVWFLLLLPCFYKQKQGRDMAGAATVLLPLHHPSNTWKVSFWQVGLVGVFLKGSRCLFEGRDGGDRGRKIFFFPCFAHPGEEENPQFRQNGTVSVPSLYFYFFFHEQCMKGRRFGQNASFHLKGKGSKNMSEFTLVLNL
jgi:hypothetical protein